MTVHSLVTKVKNLKRGIRVEVMDGEIRVSGKSYSVRDKLKALGFQWDPKNKEWYYLHPLGKRALEYNCPLPTAFANGIDLSLISSLDYYTKIAGELDTSARIAALLDNLGILFAAGKIDVESELTETLKRFVDVVPAKEANLEGYGVETVYKLKPEFEKYFGNKPDKNILKPSTEFTKELLFQKENKVKGYAVPSPFFWKLWNSSKRKALLKWLSDREYDLRKDGYTFGLRTNWIICLRRKETIHIKQVLEGLLERL